MTREEAKQTILIKSKSYESAHQNYIHLLSLHKIIDDIFDEHEAQLKAKNEKIKDLGCRLYHAEGYISDLHNNLKDKKFYDKKARSIVAMLFWEWRKHKRMYELTKFVSYLAVIHWNNATLSKLIFQKAYKMLKDNKCH